MATEEMQEQSSYENLSLSIENIAPVCFGVRHIKTTETQQKT